MRSAAATASSTVVDRRTRRHRDAVAREQLLALVLEQIHESPCRREVGGAIVVDRPRAAQTVGRCARRRRSDIAPCRVPVTPGSAGAGRLVRPGSSWPSCLLVRDAARAGTLEPRTAPFYAGLGPRSIKRQSDRRAVPYLRPRPVRRPREHPVRPRGRRGRRALHRRCPAPTDCAITWKGRFDAVRRLSRRPATASATSTRVTERLRRPRQGRQVGLPFVDRATTRRSPTTRADADQLTGLRRDRCWSGAQASSSASRRRRGSARSPRSCRPRRSRR